MRKIPADFFAGARDIAPILLGVVPFAMITGVAAVNVGLTPFEAVGMSFIVFAGASQIAVLQLMSISSPWIVMVLTAWVINLRFMMYSATLAPYFENLLLRVKPLVAYVLSDQAFAITINRFSRAESVDHTWYYTGAASVMWAAWQVSAIIGALLGTQMPDSWGFDFAFPMTFMALMFAALKDRPTVVAALIGGMNAVLGKGLPYNLGLVLGSVLGIAAGLLAENMLPPAQKGVSK